MAGPRTADEIRVEIERLLPAWGRGMSGRDELVLQAFCSMFAELEAAAQTLHERTFICLADGAWLDQHGDERSVIRTAGEIDDDYRARILDIQDVVTPNAIAARLANVMVYGTATIIEARGDGPYLMATGDDSPKGFFARPTWMPSASIGFYIVIPHQHLFGSDSFFAVPTAGGAPGRTSNFAVPTGEGAVGIFARAYTLPLASIYAQIIREVERARAWGVGFTIEVKE